MIFRRSGEPDVSLFLVADRVAAKRIGQEIPADMLHVILPAPPAAMNEETDEGFARVGMRASDVKALYGTAKLDVAYSVNASPRSGPFIRCVQEAHLQASRS
jgi:hypothetical protein